MLAFQIFCWSVLGAAVLLGLFWAINPIFEHRHIRRLLQEGKLVLVDPREDAALDLLLEHRYIRRLFREGKLR